MTLESSDVLFYTLAFLVPGFILQWTLSAFVSQKKEDAQLLFLRFITLSCANYGLWSGVIFYLFRTEVLNNHPIASAVIFFIIVFVSPIGIGLLLGKSSQNDTVRSLLIRVGFRPMHAVPNSWDYKFSHVREAAWGRFTKRKKSSGKKRPAVIVAKFAAFRPLAGLTYPLTPTKVSG